MLRYRKLCSGNNMNCTTKGCYVVWSPATRLPVLISLDKSCFLTCYTMTSKDITGVVRRQSKGRTHGQKFIFILRMTGCQKR
ncbi:uncharacterized protein LOC118009305 isoform X3 [Mirounga leonina]|uniref:uncharacterized protein LOC118009305 isoform X3 n=1 Tax=Mirounga leonina TaxID=9715 RepID=UPI00156BFA46|nr:uncharacterized protein LOC118009305 isoform X3 [Mirounga leonina]